MKKVFVVILVSCLMLAGCGGSGTGTTNNNNSTATAVTKAQAVQAVKMLMTSVTTKTSSVEVSDATDGMPLFFDLAGEKNGVENYPCITGSKVNTSEPITFTACQMDISAVTDCINKITLNGSYTLSSVPNGNVGVEELHIEGTITMDFLFKNNKTGSEDCVVSVELYEDSNFHYTFTGTVCGEDINTIDSSDLCSTI